MQNKKDYLSRRKHANFSVPPSKEKVFITKASSLLPTVDSFKPTPEKKHEEDYIHRIKNIYSPNTNEKNHSKNPRLHSKINSYKAKNSNPHISNETTSRTLDANSRIDSKLKKTFEVTYDNQKFIVQTNKFDHLTLRIAEKELMIKAKEEIFKYFPLLINSSNAISIVPSQNPNYLYYLGKGNNAELIKRIFLARPWWTQAEEENFINVNLSWTQTLNQKFIISVPLSEPLKRVHSEIDPNTDITILDNYHLGYDLITKSPSFTVLTNKKAYASASIRMHNRLEFNYNLSDKKYLYHNMKKYYQAVGENIFDYLPLTFLIETGEDDPVFLEFIKVYEYYKSRKMLNLWILKPGENCNRGNGICVCNNLDQVKNEIKSNPFPKTGEHTFVIQKYIEKPFLVNRRKFDIRLYCLITSINGYMQGYYYQDGYIRTSCKEYNPKIIDNKFIHLTNDAIQKKCDDYGKYEFANKMSYAEFQRYLDNHRPKVYLNFFDDVIPKMKKIVKDTILAVHKKLDFRRRAYGFEIYGYDFLLDDHLKPWLIEVNTNPCLELSSGLLASIIPAMVENAFRIAVDPLFPQPINLKKSNGAIFGENNLENKFELIFHELYDGPKLIEELDQRRTLNEFMN